MPYAPSACPQRVPWVCPQRVPTLCHLLALYAPVLAAGWPYQYNRPRGTARQPTGSHSPTQAPCQLARAPYTFIPTQQPCQRIHLYPRNMRANLRILLHPGGRILLHPLRDLAGGYHRTLFDRNMALPAQEAIFFLLDHFCYAQRQLLTLGPPGHPFGGTWLLKISIALPFGAAAAGVPSARSKRTLPRTNLISSASHAKSCHQAVSVQAITSITTVAPC